MCVLLERVQRRAVSPAPHWCIADYLQVDQKNESLLVPIYGLMVPFHILTVKNVSNNQVRAASVLPSCPHCDVLWLLISSSHQDPATTSCMM